MVYWQKAKLGTKFFEITDNSKKKDLVLGEAASLCGCGKFVFIVGISAELTSRLHLLYYFFRICGE